ncbi:anti-sigma regulatory factor [Domibacillus indicus]|uniref:anti-sigma regulatory factor n=1 Tax=Domibacillus indicus TaxID=1437523 RepID=UPI0006182801|nr:anti-sigma regulatory factor [Domibacillus indicus]
MDKSAVIHIQKEDDIIMARKMVREFGRILNMHSLTQARILTAVSELARNIYRYARTGHITFEAIEKADQAGLRITAMDNGPGIEDIRKALEQGYSTSGGLGAGLPGVKILMDEFSIESSRHAGTKVTVTKWQLK